MFPVASAEFAPMMFTLGVVAIIYTSLVAFAQEDMKKLIAYSSVAHMGFVTIGIFSATPQGVQGAVFQMVSHGIVSGALFLIVGIIYDRMHTRAIDAYGGLADRMPVYAALFMLFTMANVGLPGTSGFVGEFLSLLGTFRVNITTAFFATTGIILSAVYALTLYRRIVFGKLVKPSLAKIKDMSPREIGIMVPLAVLTLFLGIYPAAVLQPTAASIGAVLTDYSTSLAAARQDARIARAAFIRRFAPASPGAPPERSLPVSLESGR
jgi:NADH-quinone oxidoreductase subunit M